MGRNTQTQTRDPYAPSQPLYRQSADIVQRYLNDPNSTAVYDGPRTVAMSDTTRQGLAGLSNNAGYAQSRALMSDVVGGKYLDAGNPHLQAVQDSVRSSVMPGLNATFAKSGMIGSTMHQGTLTRALTDGMAQPLFQNYENERGRQMTAAQMLPGMDQADAQNKITAGQLGEGYDREKIMADWQRWQELQDAPLRALQKTMPFTQAIGGAGGTSTTTSSQSPWQTAAGIGMMGMSAIGGSGFGAGLGYTNPWAALVGGGMFGRQSNNQTDGGSYNLPRPYGY